MIAKENYSLLSHNTFAVDAKAKLFVELDNTKHLEELLASDLLKNQKFLLLGDGSNLLFTKDYDGLVIKINNKGITHKEIESKVHLEVSAGENWDDFVAFCVQNNWGGLENLSLIPGTVGASPFQNIGAYGVEAKDRIEKVEVYDFVEQKFYFLSNKECGFAYRNSIFKEKPNKLLIWKVHFCLERENHQLVLDYGEILAELEKNKVQKPSIKDLRETIVSIRNSKLPNPKEIPNAGSFFKNPVVNQNLFADLQKKHPDIKSFPAENGTKIAAAWLIEKMGWKGKKVGNVGVHNKQALVIVNPEKGSGKEILELSERIIESVAKEFGIELEREVCVV